jgi:Tfp pilus assembly protein PilX
VALLFALFALLLVTGIAMGLMFLADTETNINSNYRDEQTAFYSAKAGLEEVRDRMRSNAGAGISLTPYLPAVLPGAAGGVLYVLNPANGEAVTP